MVLYLQEYIGALGMLRILAGVRLGPGGRGTSINHGIRLVLQELLVQGLQFGSLRFELGSNPHCCMAAKGANIKHAQTQLVPPGNCFAREGPFSSISCKGAVQGYHMPLHACLYDMCSIP